MGTPCLSHNAVKRTVDGPEKIPMASEIPHLEGNTGTVASNSSAGCRLYGVVASSANPFYQISAHRHLATDETLGAWMLGWSDTTSAHVWCAKSIADFTMDGRLVQGKNTTVSPFHTPILTRVSVKCCTNHRRVLWVSLC